MAEDCDVLVIGGGPAGSTAAALLAERGHDVVLLEKDAHPRFHIGESLLPRNLQILDRLGVSDQVTALGVYKPGAEFVDDDTGRDVAFAFALSRVKGAGHAWQVPRAEFDRMLFANAAARGARTAEHTRVTTVTGDAADGRLRVLAEGPEGARELAPRFVLDASGRDTFMAGRHGLKVSDKRNNTAAVFAHYRGVAPRPDERRGYITIHLAQDGWFWMIPLPDDIMSVGFVGTSAAFRRRRGPLPGFFDQLLRDSPTVSARMRGAERISDVIGTANYSYRARRIAGERWMMIGDAFGFIDPMFSSGVLLAMSAGELGADVAVAWLTDPARGAAMARRAERQLAGAMDRIGWLIRRINTPVLRHMFMSPTNALGMRDGLVSMLAGNLRASGNTRLPVLAFKTTYYALTLLGAGRGNGWIRQSGAMRSAASPAATGRAAVSPSITSPASSAATP